MIGTTLTTTAQTLRITEILYDAEGADTGKEYIEVVHTGIEPIRVQDIRFSEHGRTHTILSGTAEQLEQGTVALIVANPETFKEHYTTKGVLLHAGVFSLNNETSTITIGTKEGRGHTVSYRTEDGGNGNGNAIHIDKDNRIDEQAPSPGIVRGIPLQEKQEEEEQKLETKLRILAKPTPIFFAAETTFAAEYKGEARYGKWNFGDGTATLGRQVTHSYAHPGRYLLSFEEILLGEEGEIKNIQKEIQVRIPKIFAERIDETTVVVTNEHPEHIEISGWTLVAGTAQFVFPEDSHILPQNRIYIQFSTKENTKLVWVASEGGIYVATKEKEETIKSPSLNPQSFITLWLIILTTLMVLATLTLTTKTKIKEKKPRRKRKEKK